MEVRCSICQMALRSSESFSLPLKPIREVLSLIRVAVALFYVPSLPLIFTCPEVMVLLTCPYRTTSADAAKGRAAAVKVINIFFMSPPRILKLSKNTKLNHNDLWIIRQLFLS